MRIGIPRESRMGEKRGSLQPPKRSKNSLSLVLKCALSVTLALEQALIDSAFEASGARITTAQEAWSSDIVLKVEPPSNLEVDRLKAGAFFASFLEKPAQNEALNKRLADKKVTALAHGCCSRISRAQKMDALSSMANVADYRAVIEASHLFGSFFTGQITAAGKVPPAKVLVIGAGVAGLAAIAAARGLGAIVRAFDTRAAVKDQVESLGGEFLELDFEEDGEGSGGYAKVMSEAFIQSRDGHVL